MVLQLIPAPQASAVQVALTGLREHGVRVYADVLVEVDDLDSVQLYAPSLPVPKLRSLAEPCGTHVEDLRSLAFTYSAEFYQLVLDSYDPQGFITVWSYLNWGRAELRDGTALLLRMVEDRWQRAHTLPKLTNKDGSPVYDTDANGRKTQRPDMSWWIAYNPRNWNQHVARDLTMRAMAAFDHTPELAVAYGLGDLFAYPTFREQAERLLGDGRQGREQAFALLREEVARQGMTNSYPDDDLWEIVEDALRTVLANPEGRE